ncbi:MAG TPA: DUF917 domain-containing protein [Solirubrobacteraceae bacterium]
MNDAPAQVNLSETDLEDIVNGACLYGAGGGGPWSLGQSLMKEIVAAGKPVALADPSAMPAAATACVSAGVGSPDAASSGFPYDAASSAFEALSAMQGTPFSYVLPAELGAANSILPMTVAASKGFPILDAAGSPRAVPALQLSSFAIRGAPLGTVVLANDAQRVFFDGHDAATADQTMRQIISSGAFTEDAGAALWAMDGKTLRPAVIAGTTTAARRLGAALREALAAKQDPVAAVVKGLGGKLLTVGKIVGSVEQTGGGFDVGVLTIRGSDGALMRIINQNENILAWPERSQHPIVLAPDLICFMSVAGQPFSNADLDLVHDQEVAVIGAPAEPAYRDRATIAAFSPFLQSAGYGGPYVPIEELWG